MRHKSVDQRFADTFYERAWHPGDFIQYLSLEVADGAIDLFLSRPPDITNSIKSLVEQFMVDHNLLEIDDSGDGSAFNMVTESLGNCAVWSTIPIRVTKG